VAYMKRALLPVLIAAGLVAAALCAVATLRAQDSNASAEPDGQYEPGRAVARISVLNGDVSVRRGDSGDVVAAALNAPLMADDRLLTSSSSRAEVQLDSSNILRIGPNSEVRFVGMDVKSFQIQIAAGTATFRTLRASQAQVEVDTPSVAVRPLRPGAYRVSVHDDGTSEISVRSGEAEIDSQRGGERLQAGQTMVARGAASDAEFQVVQAAPYDNWDRWNDDRDRYLLNSQSYRHVSPDISGAEDLDQYGQWVNDPSYGSVWHPNVAADWAPYRDGRWVWEDYYGWTWVSADPWGWAPYHYGRWFSGPAGWSWYPGEIYAHPYWAPAYVGFFGFGDGGFGVGFGFGGVGWVPLAPFEVCHPWWGRGFYGEFRNGGFGNHTTIVNNVNIYNTYRNAGVAGGVTGGSAEGFGRGGRFASLNRSQIQTAGAVRGVLPVAPDRSSLRLSDRAVSGRFPQDRTQSFASRMQAPRVDHASFTQQQRGVQQMSQQVSRSNFSRPAGGPAGGNEAGRVGNSGVAGAANPGGFAQRPQQSVPGGGWQRMGDRPAGVTGSSAGGGSAVPGSSAHGWNRFGEPIHGTSGGTSSGTTGVGNAAPQRFERSYTPPAWNRETNRAPAASGFERDQNSQPSRGAPNSFARGGGQPVRISPPIVEQRGYSAPREYSQPRSFGGSRVAPSYGGGGGAERVAPNYGGGGGGRNFGGGAAPSFGGGGGRNFGGGAAPSYGGGGGGRNFGGGGAARVAPSNGGGGARPSGGGGQGGGGGHHR
jgi:hypothetical protein